MSTSEQPVSDVRAGVPVAFLLLLMCCPSRLRTWLLTRLRWLGFAIALLLLAPYLFS